MRVFKGIFLFVGALYCLLTALGMAGLIDFKVCIGPSGMCHVLFDDELPPFFSDARTPS
ncbi:hypothetical protein [Paraburkholderia fungorum]|uniref:hypothetical protein n=1 Tax=Paraburkholderia fungorum TaxID=134537 RepID=UPI00402B45C6